MHAKPVFKIAILSTAAFLAALLLLILTRSSYAFEPEPQTVWPPRNAITATLNTTITLTYDEPISATAVTSHTFAVHGMQSGLVTGTHGVIDGDTLIVTPTRPFHQGELVYAIATTRTLAISGTAPLSATQWQFNAGVVRERCVAGFSEVYGGSLTGVYLSSVAWGDYDNDGDLDILLTGYVAGGRISRVYQNTGSGFSEAYAGSLTDVGGGSVAWGDYDNDGDLDILLTGADDFTMPTSKVYQNTGSGFSKVYGLTAVRASSVAWGDYDNDGDLDILLTGSVPGGRVSRVYQNTGSGFSEAYAGSLTGVQDGSVAWGDYDNDGDLDILLTGADDSFIPISKVYQNTGSGFSKVYGLTAVRASSVAWGDYDNDGDLDILLTGHTGSGPISKVYRNDDCQRIYLPLVLRSGESAGVLAHRSGGETACNPPVSYGMGARTQTGRSQMQYALVRLAAVMGLAGSALFLAAGMDEESARLGACLLLARAPPGRRRGACKRRAPS